MWLTCSICCEFCPFPITIIPTDVDDSPDEDLEQSARLHSWVSLAYTSQAGVYVSVYYHSSLA